MLSDTEKGTNIEVTGLHGDLVKSLISNIHFIETRTKFFDRPLYCRAIRDLTPKKSPTTSTSRMEVSKTSHDSDTNSEDDLGSYDFTEDVSLSKSPSYQLFKKGNDSTNDEDIENEKEFKVNKVTICKVNSNKRGRNSSGKKTNGGKK